MNLKPRHALLGIAVLFLIGFIANLVTGEAEPGDTAAQWAAIVLGGGGFVFIEREERARDRLFDFLRSNVDAIRGGTAEYAGQTLTYATRVRVHTIVVSLLFASFKIQTRPLIIGERGSSLLVRLASSLVTLVFGWWGIPWGPIWTVKALVDNARGVPVFTLGELIEGRAGQRIPMATYTR